MASKKNQTSKTDLRNSIRSQFIGDEQELFDLLVAHYVRGEAQRKNIIGDYHRTGMAPERAKAVALAAIQYLVDSPKRTNDGRYPRQICLHASVAAGEMVRVYLPGVNRYLPSLPLPEGRWQIVAIEIVEDECPETQRGTHG